MNDLDILDDLRQGRAPAFRTLVDRYQAIVLNCVFRFVRDRQTAEDLTQEVFMEVYDGLPSFRGESQLSTWIYRIAVTRSLNHIKAMKRKKRFAFLTSLFGEGPEPLDVAASTADGPAAVLENQERAHVLHQALEALPETQRVAFTLSKVEGLSYEEIAGVMHVSIPAVESLIHRARVRLRELLRAYYQEHLT